MIRRAFLSIVTVLFACSTGTAADIRRVVTGLDANNKAVAIFDSRLTLAPGNPAFRRPISGSELVAARILIQGR